MIDHDRRLRKTQRRYLNDNHKRLPYKEDQENQQYVLRNTPNFKKILYDTNQRHFKTITIREFPTRKIRDFLTRKIRDFPTRKIKKTNNTC